MNRTGCRPVTIAAVSGTCGDLQTHFELIGMLAAQHPDVVMLAENWTRRGPETMDGPIIRRLRDIAAENGVYILHTTMLLDGDRLYNSALMFGRDGGLAGRYDKQFPYYAGLPEDPAALQMRPRELESVPGAARQPLIGCDFGEAAVRTCFDANFPETWAEAAEQGAELVLWPSAYAAGRQLEAHALEYHYPIVTATRTGSCIAVDIDGSRILDTQGAGDTLTGQFVTLDLDRCIFHENFNMEKLEKLLAEKPPRVELERHWRQEQWLLVRAASPGVSARQVCREAGMEELRSYKERSRTLINALRPA